MIVFSVCLARSSSLADVTYVGRLCKRFADIVIVSAADLLTVVFPARNAAAAAIRITAEMNTIASGGVSAFLS